MGDRLGTQGAVGILLFFPSVGYEAKSLSFGNKLHDLSIFEKKNYQSIVTKINYMIRKCPKIFLSVGFVVKSLSSSE